MDRNSVWYQNQNYLSICTTNHKNFGPGGKTRVSAAGSSLRPQNGVFEHLDKILSSPTGLSDEKSFYCGSLCYRLVLIHKKKRFWNRKFFHVGIHQKLIFFQLQKNQCSPLSPQFHFLLEIFALLSTSWHILWPYGYFFRLIHMSIDIFSQNMWNHGQRN